jgi:transporter family-2 protein
MLYMLLAVVAGAVLPLQAVINARLAANVGGASWAAAISFLVGAVGLLVVQIVTRAPWPGLDRLAAVPIWTWVGGLLGAVYVVSVIISVPRLGTASVIALVIFGQLVVSLLLDHFGVLVAAPHPINAIRLIGASLLFGGALMVLRG